MIRWAGILMGAVLVAALAGLEFRRQRAEHLRLEYELMQLSQQLNEVNATAAQNADFTVKFMRYAVEENRHQGDEVMVLASAEALRGRTIALLRQFRARRRALLRAGGPADSVARAQPSGIPLIEGLHDSDQRAFAALRQQLAIYGAKIRRLDASDSTQRVVLPLITDSPAMAWTSLVQAENDLLAAEARTLRHLTQQIGRQEPRAKVVAIALVQSNRVAPGVLYRARLQLIKSLLSPSIRMFCNGKPIPTDRDGAGLVHFTAPTTIGPAEWHGTIRARLQGRDTTFQVRVPYRVVRR